MSHTIVRGAHRQDLPAEYWLYFVPILLTALPASLVQWLLAHGRSGKGRTNPGPLRRAVRTAHAITPQIFSA